jgi:soluble lytic murein transglycosylase-like protein
LLAQYAWDVDVALAVMQAESGCDPSAFNGANSNGSNDAGLMQVNSIHVASGLIGDDERFDAEANVRAAWAIYAGRGSFSPWSAYNNGAYEKFL